LIFINFQCINFRQLHWYCHQHSSGKPYHQADSHNTWKNV